MKSVESRVAALHSLRAALDQARRPLKLSHKRFVETHELFEQTSNLDRDAIYFHYPNYAFHKKNRLGGVIRKDDYKLIKRYGDDTLELYNLAEDIGEKKNLANESPEHARRLEHKLDTWLRETGAKMPVQTNVD